jgi:PAS domain S-box-containing protein
VLDVIHEDGTPYHPPELPFARSALFGEEHHDVEMQIRWPDGSHRHILTNSVPIRDAAGRINGAVGMFQDITRRKHDEEALKQREQEYHLLMEQASDGIVIVNNSGGIVAANSRACELAGYDRSEVVSIDGSQIVPGEDLVSLRGTMRKITPDKGVITEHRLRRKDGTIINVESSIRLLSDGRYQAIIRDITDRKRNEEEFARVVMPHVYERLFVMLREFQHGGVLTMNLHRLALFARNLKIFSGDGAQANVDAHSRLESAVDEFRTITRQKLQGIASLLRTVENDLSTDRTQNEERVSGAEILMLTEELQADTDNLLNIAQQHPNAPHRGLPAKWGARIASHAEALSQKIGDITRLMNERFTTSVVDVAASAAKVSLSKMPEVPVDVVEVTPGLKGLISAAELAEILSLLLMNAVDALIGVGSNPVERDKHITIRLMEKNARVRIEVEDTGPGVPPEFREMLFERGFTTKGEGHGLGLGSARDHLSIYGGELTHEETAHGGARFVVTLVRMKSGA